MTVAKILGALIPVAAGSVAASGAGNWPAGLRAGGGLTGVRQGSHGVWLGVQLSPVPAALASHLQLKETGLMVRNVFRDSPADEAGLQRYDVMVEADGRRIVDCVEAFIKHVRGKESADSVRLSIYRAGHKQELSVKLAERPGQWGELELKYEDDPDLDYWRQSGLRGKILRPGPDGWELKDLGEFAIPGWPDVHDWLYRQHEGWFDEPEIDEGWRVDKQGRALRVRRRDDGTIVVKRHRRGDDEQEAEVRTYDSMEELLKNDPEAYRLLRPDPPGLGRFDGFDRRDSGREKRPPAPRRQRPLVKPEWREWYERFFQGPLKNHLKDLKGSLRFRLEEEESESAPQRQTRFEVQPDGRITVHLHGDRGELSMTFESKEAFQQRAPELYQQFQSLEDKIR